MCQSAERVKRASPGRVIPLLQLDIFGFSLNKDRDIEVGVFPESKEIVVGSAQIANRKAWNNCRFACFERQRDHVRAADGVLSWFAYFLHLRAAARVAARAERLFHLRPQQVQDDSDV